MRRVWLKLVLSAALLAWLLSRTPFAALARELSQLGPATLAAGAALSVAAWLVSALRLWCLAPAFGLGTVTRMTFVGLLYGTLLPGQAAGDVVKAWRLSRTQASPGLAAAVTLVDRGAATLVLFAIGAVAAARIPTVPPLRPLFALSACAVLAGGLLLSTTLAQRTLARVRHAAGGFPSRLLAMLERVAVALHAALRRPGRLLACGALAIVFHMLCIAIHLLIARALDLHLGTAEWAVAYAAVSLLLLLPVSFAGIGLREGGYVGLLSLFGIGREAALALSFVLLGYTLFGALIGGALELCQFATSRRRAARASAGRTAVPDDDYSHDS